MRVNIFHALVELYKLLNMHRLTLIDKTALNDVLTISNYKANENIHLLSEITSPKRQSNLID